LKRKTHLKNKKYPLPQWAAGFPDKIAVARMDLCSTFLGNDQTLRNHYVGNNMALHAQNLFPTVFAFGRRGG